MNSISDRELLENRDRVEQLRFTASVVGELIARNQIELVLGSDAAWKMIRELAEERCFQALREIRNVLDDSGLTVSFPCPWEEALTGGPDNFGFCRSDRHGPAPAARRGSARRCRADGACQNPPLPARRRGLLFGKRRNPLWRPVWPCWRSSSGTRPLSRR